MNERVEVRRAQRVLEAEAVAFCSVLVVLEVGGRQALFLRIGADGGIHRLGSGSLETFERDRFIGVTTPETFRELSAKITPELLGWCGQPRSHPAPRGETCELVLAFKREDGEESMMAWRYGSCSKWPPREVLDFVDAAVEATRPWYEEQQRQLRLRLQRAEFEWWDFFKLPHA